MPACWNKTLRIGFNQFSEFARINNVFPMLAHEAHNLCGKGASKHKNDAPNFTGKQVLPLISFFASLVTMFLNHSRDRRKSSNLAQKQCSRSTYQKGKEKQRNIKRRRPTKADAILCMPAKCRHRQARPPQDLFGAPSLCQWGRNGTNCDLKRAL